MGCRRPQMAPVAHGEQSKIWVDLDITVLKHKTLYTYPSRSIKISVNIKNENEIPEILNVMDLKVNLA
ncbi:hypothetical protein AYI68_g7112 [Smittium mucronatum]|uniref:Uncharacterized protein n=1 Tax=Smittium mucronatum TaxID=133383 RepID=A0A1R0GPK0_9FUNG|nr:hypothetical protein AYI68_g7112 [Smittium mucronatum]